MKKRVVDLLSITDPKAFADTLDRQTDRPEKDAPPTMRLVFIPDAKLEHNMLQNIDKEWLRSTGWLRNEGLLLDDMLLNIKPSGIGWKGSYDGDSVEVYDTGPIRLSISDSYFFPEAPSTEADAEPERVLGSVLVVQYPVIFLRFVKLVLGRADIESGGTVEMIYDNIAQFSLAPGGPNNAYRHHEWRKPESDHLIYQHELAAGFNPDIEARVLLMRFYADFGFEPGAIPLWDATHNMFSIDTEGAEAT